MQTVESTCPFCHATREYDSELVGRYTFCQSCRGRFYVEVPPLGSSGKPSNAASKPAAVKRETTLDDLLWDTQQGGRHILQLLKQQASLAQTTRLLLVGVLLVGLANLGLLAWLLMR